MTLSPRQITTNLLIVLQIVQPLLKRSATAPRRLLAILWLIAPLLLSPALQAKTQPTGDAGSDPRILPDLEQERLQALADSQLPDTQTLWLETQHESFLGLFQPANHPAPMGAVLLLHHDRTSADWPGTITTLRHGLPDQGWHTLSLALPDEPEYLPPRIDDITLSGRDAAPDNTASSTAANTAAAVADESEDKLQAHFEQISARIESGLSHLAQFKPPLVLIVGEGSGGYWALRFNISQQDQHRLFPVLIDTVAPITPTEPALVELIAQLQRPTLDLYHGDGRQQQQIEVLAQQRRNAAKREGHQFLISYRMTSRAGNWRQPDKRLLGIMRGMVQKLIATNPQGQQQDPDQPLEQQPPN